MAKDIQKQIEKLNKKVDNLIKKYKKISETKKKKKDKEFIEKVMSYYVQFESEEKFFQYLDAAVENFDQE